MKQKSSTKLKLQLNMIKIVKQKYHIHLKSSSYSYYSSTIWPKIVKKTWSEYFNAFSLFMVHRNESCVPRHRSRLQEFAPTSHFGAFLTTPIFRTDFTALISSCSGFVSLKNLSYEYKSMLMHSGLPLDVVVSIRQYIVITTANRSHLQTMTWDNSTKKHNDTSSSNKNNSEFQWNWIHHFKVVSCCFMRFP